MAGISGVETVIYGAEEVDPCVRSLVDFDLPLIERRDGSALFELAERFSAIIGPLADAVVEGKPRPGQRDAIAVGKMAKVSG